MENSPVSNLGNPFGMFHGENQQEAKQYFDTLPAYIQENITQSGVEINSLEHLKQMAEHYQSEE